MPNKVTIDVEARFDDGVTNESKNAAKAIDELGKKAASASKQVNQLGNNGKKVKIDVDNRSFTQKIRDAETKARNLGKTKTAMVLTVVDKATSVINAVTSKAKSLAGRTWRTAVALKDSNVLKSLREIESIGKNIAGKTWRVTLKLVDLATSPLRAVKNTLFSIKGLVTAIVAGVAANKLIAEPISLADAYSNAQIGFSTLLGEARGQQMMDDLDEFARTTPFKTSEVIANAQKMIAMGWQAEDIIKDMTTIGDAAAAAGQGDEGLNRIILALSQIQAKGKLSTEELNQLAEANISAKRYIAEGLGYGSGDEGLAALSKDLEGGKIYAGEALDAILSGMKEYSGMMETTATETVKGLKSTIEDTFEINIFRRWGQGLQDGAKRGLGSVVDLLDKSENALADVGDTLYELGATASNWAADKLMDAVNAINEITSSADFKNAGLGDQIKMLWDGVIGNPLADWWDNTVVPWWDNTAVPWLEEKAAGAGQAIGTGLTKGLLTLFGASDTLIDGAEQGAGIAGSFVQGFLDGFDGSAITNALVDAVGNVWDALPTWAKALLGGYGMIKAGGLISKGISGVQTIGGLIGSTGNAMVNGSGLLGGLASAGYAATGGAAASTLGGGAAAALGGGVILGIGTGAASGVLGIADLATGLKNDDVAKTKAGMWEAGGGLGGMAAGAAIGTALGGPLIGTAIGGLIGGGIGLYQGWKIKKEAKEAAEAAEKLARAEEEARIETERLAAVQLEKKFGDIKLSADELSAAIDNLIGQDLIDRANASTTAINEMESSYKSLESANENLKKALWTPTFGTAKEEAKLSQDQLDSLTTSYKDFATSAKTYLDDARYASSSAISAIVQDEEDLQKVLDTSNAFYDDRSQNLSEKTAAMESAVNDALSDGVITIDEEKSLQVMRQQISDLMAQLESDEYTASMNIIKAQYGGDEDISLGSFEDLIKQGADAAAAVEEGFWQQFGKGSIGMAEGSDAWNTLLGGTLDSISGAWDDVANLGLEKIQTKWEDELLLFTGSFDEIMSNSKADLLLAANSLSDETQINLGEMLEMMKPTTEQIQEIADSYAQLGQEIPEAISNYLNTEELYSAIAEGDAAIVDYINAHKFEISPGIEVNPDFTYQLYQSEELISEDTSLTPQVMVAPEYSYNKFDASKLIDNNISLNPTITINPNYVTSGGTPGSARGGVWYPSGINTKGYANGGIVSGGARLITVAEEGSPEVVIPTSSQRRDRGIKLWQKAGEMLNVPGFARGGLTNGGDEGLRFKTYDSANNTDTGRTVQIDVSGLSVSINIDATGSANIVEAIQAQREEIAEAVSGILADAFTEQFENTPTRGGVA